MAMPGGKYRFFLLRGNLLDTATNWLKTRDFTHNMLSNSDRRVLVEKLQDIIAATQSLKYL